MSKSSGRRRQQARRRERGRRKFVVAACLALSLLLVGVVLAGWGTSGDVSKPRATLAAMQTPPSPSNPSKEYIYAGGRLVAAEEPTPAPTPTPFPACAPPSTVIIGEFRFRGAAGAADEFVELHNTSDSPVTVCTADGSNGWAVAAVSADGQTAATRFVVPYGTVIPGRGHYLAVNSAGYSLSSYPAGVGTTATPDISYTTDIADNSGIALFKTSNPANFNASNRLDAAGFSGHAGALSGLYREGAGITPVGTSNGEYSFIRRFVSGTGLASDTADNAADFMFISTSGGSFGGAVASVLGAPAPEKLSSPVRRTDTVPGAVIDPAVASSVAPNRVRDLTPVTNGDSGTLSIRRKYTNNTGAAVTRLRFRVTTMTTLNNRTSSQVDFRALNSSNTTATLADGSQVTVLGTTVETPPAQGIGGGINSTFSVALPGGSLAAGASVNVQFLLGLMATGNFSFFINVEALP